MWHGFSKEKYQLMNTLFFYVIAIVTVRFQRDTSIFCPCKSLVCVHTCLLILSCHHIWTIFQFFGGLNGWKSLCADCWLYCGWAWHFHQNCSQQFWCDMGYVEEKLLSSWASREITLKWLYSGTAVLCSTLCVHCHPVCPKTLSEHKHTISLHLMLFWAVWHVSTHLCCHGCWGELTKPCFIFSDHARREH